MAGRILAIFLVVLLAGCAAKTPPPVVKVDPNALLQQVQAQRNQFSGLKGTARLKISTPDKNQSSTQALVIERPDQLRADVLSPFGQPVLQMTVTQGRLEAYVPSRKEVYRGAASADNLFRFTHIPLRINDLIALCLYSPPLISDSVDSVQDTNDGVTLLLADGQRFQRLFFDAGGRLTGAHFLQQDQILLTVEWDDFDDAAQGFPKSIHMELPLEQASAWLEYRKIDLNPTIAPKTYTLRIPDSATPRMIP